MSVETMIDLIITAWDKAAYAKMNAIEKTIYYIGLLFNAFGFVTAIILLYRGWERWWALLLICWMIGIPMIWGARLVALRRKV